MADPAHCVLNLLHALDIQDKHRVVLRGISPVPIRRVRGGVSLEMQIGFAPDLLIGEPVMELLSGLVGNVRGIVRHVQGTLDEFDEGREA